jgi:hypothetical protein
METRRKRAFFVLVLMATAAAFLGAQQATQSRPYEGTSNPPPDDQIVTTAAPPAKPPAGQPLYSQPESPATAVTPAASAYSGSDESIVQGARPLPNPAQPALAERAGVYDPDGDIVHPRPVRRGELVEGTTIRVRLLNRLSTVDSEKGERFQTQVASEVFQGDQVLIPVGARIEGTVVQVSSGHPGGYGTLRLRPDWLTLPNGNRFQLYAETTGTQGSKTRVVGEGTIRPTSRWKRDGIEYGSAVGAGAVTGAILGGPAGAATGSIIGAGVITAHLLVSHPQAHLDPGTDLMFTLTQPLDLVPARAGEN